MRTTKRKEIADLLRDLVEGEDFEDEPDVGYESAKERQAFIEGRILDLERILANAQILEHPSSRTRVSLGSTVTILDLTTGETETYTIVGPAETNPRLGMISDQSPMGKALLGRGRRARVTVPTPNGRLEVRILKIE